MGTELANMDKMLIVQQPKGTIDTAGGTPQDWEDYIVGPDGVGIPADIQDPRPETAIMALAENITLTHTIRIRYDTRIKADMRAKWYFESAWHYARIHTVAPTTNNTWMMLDCKEHTTQAGAY
jgi:head-tail adaptor